MITDWVLWLIYAAVVVGLAKLLNASVFKKSARSWAAWTLAIGMFAASFIALFLLKIASGRSGSPFDNLWLAALLAWLFFASLNRSRKPATTDPRPTDLSQLSGAMNGKQRLTLMVTIAAIIIAILFPPFHGTLQNGQTFNLGYAFLFSPPHWADRPVGVATVNIAMLFAEWLGIALIAGLCFFLTSDRQRPQR